MNDIEMRDPATRYWVQSAKAELEGKLGTTFSLSNGVLGIRGAHVECPAWGRPEFYVAGTYAGGPSELLGLHDPDHILTHPDRITPAALSELDDKTIWTLPNLPYPIACRLWLNREEFDFDKARILSSERLLEIDRAILRRCLVWRCSDGPGCRVDSCRFVSMADRNLVCLRYRVTPLESGTELRAEACLNTAAAENTNGIPLWSPGKTIKESGRKGMECIAAVSNTVVSIAQQSQSRLDEGGLILDVFAIAGEMPLDEAMTRAEAAAAAGFDDCRRAHREEYGEQRDAALVEFDGLPATVQGFNFGQMHLHMAVGPKTCETGVPIKGLTGHGYRFLNFWDMDFHMFPYYLMTQPHRAKDLLRYRYGQLDAYRRNAKHWGAAGAQVPWETNTRGEEETAPWLCLQDREIHISADAAHMFRRYADITGDDSVMVEMGAEFILETARFYASRIQWNEARQRYELPDIGCPDQYHTFADNNVFISLWARWNLREALTVLEESAYAAAVDSVGVTEAEVREWREMAAGLYIITPNEDGIIEEFDGFFDLDKDLSGISETYCSHSQAVKQPDVLAAFIPFEDDYPEHVRRANWHYYNRRTLHGSSLSLPGMAYAAARCGLLDEALDNLHRSCRLDLDDVNLDTERGVHVSGGAVEWCTLVFGFGGLTATRNGLRFQPRLPRQWTRLRFTVYWHFQRVDIELTHQTLAIHVGSVNQVSVPIQIGDDDWVSVNAGSSMEQIIINEE